MPPHLRHQSRPFPYLRCNDRAPTAPGAARPVRRRAHPLDRSGFGFCLPPPSAPTNPQGHDEIEGNQNGSPTRADTQANTGPQKLRSARPYLVRDARYLDAVRYAERLLVPDRQLPCGITDSTLLPTPSPRVTRLAHREATTPAGLPRLLSHPADFIRRAEPTRPFTDRQCEQPYLKLGPSTVTAGEVDDLVAQSPNSINLRTGVSVAVRAPRPEGALRGDAAPCTYKLHQGARPLCPYPQRLPETLRGDRTLIQLTMPPILTPRPLQQLSIHVHTFSPLRRSAV